MLKRKKENKSKSLYLIGSLLILSSISIMIYKYFDEKQTNKIEEISIQEYYKEEDNEKEQIKETNVEDSSNKIENSSKEEVKKNQNVVNYIAILRIPKINLKRGLVDKESKYNDIKYNIMIHEKSTYPDSVGGNVILLAHSGNSTVSYFKNLYKLKLDDIIYLDYNNKTYKYKLVNIYDIEKNGKALIKKDVSKSTITLITCRANTNKQIVLIGELIA